MITNLQETLKGNKALRNEAEQKCVNKMKDLGLLLPEVAIKVESLSMKIFFPCGIFSCCFTEHRLDMQCLKEHEVF